MVRVIRIIFTMMKIIMMIIIKSEILLMITTILKMMVFTVSHACMRVKHDDEKDGFKMIDLIFAGLFSPAKDARFRRDLSHPRRCLDL